MVMVPFAASTWPVFSNCTGPTKLRLVSEGGGPKYDRGTVVPMDAGAGNKLHPGPGPIGPGPGPWSKLNVPELDDPEGEEPPEVGVTGEFKLVPEEVGETSPPPFEATETGGRSTPPPKTGAAGERLEAAA